MIISQVSYRTNGPLVLMARVYFKFCFTIIYTGVFSYQYAPAIFRNKLTTLLAFEQSSLARNRQLDEFVHQGL